MRNKRRVASALLAGCMMGTSIVPAFAAAAPVSASTTTICVGIGNTVKAHNVTDISVLNMGASGAAVTAAWDDTAQQFVIAGAKDGDSLILAWADENSKTNTAQVTIAGGKATLKMISSYADIDGFRCWKAVDGKTSVSIPYIAAEGEEAKFLFVPAGEAVSKMESGTGRVMVNGTCADGRMTAAFAGLVAGQTYDVYVGSNTTFQKMADSINPDELLSVEITELEFEDFEGIEVVSAAFMLNNAGSTQLEEYTLSAYSVQKTPVDGVMVTGSPASGFMIIDAAKSASIPEILYLWHKDVCIAALTVKGDITTVPNPVPPAETPETPANENQISLPAGSSLLFAYGNGQTGVPASDSLNLSIQESAVSSFANTKLALSASDQEITAVPGLSVANVMVGDGVVTMDIVASSYNEIKDLESVYLFYDRACLGRIETNAVVAEKPVFALGEDKVVDLTFAYNAMDTDEASDLVDIVSNHQADAARFELRTSKYSTDTVPASFQTSGASVTISMQKTAAEGAYALFYDGEYLGDIEVRKTISDAPDASVTVLSNGLNFEFESGATAMDKKSDKVVLNITNPKNETISAADFALKVKASDGTLTDSDLLKIEGYSEAEKSLTVSLARGDGDAPQFEVVVLFRGLAVNEENPLHITSMVQPDQNPYLAESIHELVAGSYDTDEDGIPDAALPYREDYANDSRKQAEHIQTVVQKWMDQVAEMDGYGDWAGAKISVFYDEASEQFKSTVSIHGVISDAKVWNVTIAAKPAADPAEDPSDDPVKDTAPSVSVARITMNRTSKQNVAFDLGTGESAATEALISVEDGSIASISTGKITAENQKSGLTITGLKKGSTKVIVAFNDAAQTKVEIPVKINALMHKVSTSSGTNGTISCTTASFDGTVEEGASLTFNITPKSGYKVSEVLVDGQSVGSVTSYTLKNIDKSHSIFAQFEKEGSSSTNQNNSNSETEKDNLKPDISCGKGGEVKVLSDNVTCLINPDKGYVIKKVVANGKSVGAVDYYEFSKASASNTLDVTFAKATVETKEEKDPVVTVINNPSTDTTSTTQSTTDAADTGMGLYTTAQTKFTDIAGHWAEEAIIAFERNGWVSGVGDSTFAPEMNMTRGMFVTILGRMDGGMAMTDCIFDDVSSDKYYAEYVQWAFEKGIASGVGGSRFAPDANITRQEMAVMVNNYLINKGDAPAAGASAFSDENEIASWAKDAVNALANAGFVSGKGDNRFDPKANATRAELVSILYRVNNSLA